MLRRLPHLLLVAAATAGFGCDQSRSTGSGTPQSADLSLDSIRCGQRRATGGCVSYDVSLYELLANPAPFQGHRVRVIGFAHFEREGNGLYPHREDWERHIARNGLWLDPPARSDSLSDHYVIVEARFDAKARGHLGMWSGTLDSVTRLERFEISPMSPMPDSAFRTLPSLDSSRTVPSKRP